jgi:hypothetical protein
MMFLGVLSVFLARGMHLARDSYCLPAIDASTPQGSPSWCMMLQSPDKEIRLVNDMW